MRAISVLVVMGLTAAACSGGTVSDSTTRPTESSMPSSAPSTSQPELTSTTTFSQEPTFDLATLPTGPCSLDAPTASGEVTVLVGDRLYGLGADLASPRCLLEGDMSPDLAWGPAADRIRVGNTVYGTDFEPIVFADDSTLEWTAPTGSRVVVIDGDAVTKVAVDGSADINVKFLTSTEAVAYHPAGTHFLAVGTDTFGQYGLWFADNDGVNFVLLAFDEDATISDPTWSWLNEPLFVARHLDGRSHIHRVELVDGNFEGPIVVETADEIDRLMASPFDPVMLGYRLRGEAGSICVAGSTAAVSGVDLPSPLADQASTPVGWLSGERLLILAFPDGCDSPADLWAFSAGFCPGSTYGAELLVSGVDGAAAREAVPVAPPSPDFGGVIDPAPA